MSKGAAARALLGRHCWQRGAANHRGDDLGCIQESLWRQVGVTLGHPNLGMPEEPLDDVERYAPIDQEAGERVAQVVEPDIGQTCATSNAVPGMEHRGVRTSSRRGEDILIVLRTGQRLQQRDGCSVERELLGLPDFDKGTSNVRRCQSTCSHLPWVTSLRRAPVSKSSMTAWAAIGSPPRR